MKTTFATCDEEIKSIPFSQCPTCQLCISARNEHIQRIQSKWREREKSQRR